MEIRLNPGVEKFIVSLEDSTIAKLLRTIDLLERFGHQLGLPHSRKIGQGLFELRVRGQQEARIFYTFHKGSAILLYGFVKKSQRIPQKELQQAFKKLRDLT